jgi:hypothetical protein
MVTCVTTDPGAWYTYTLRAVKRVSNKCGAGKINSQIANQTLPPTENVCASSATSDSAGRLLGTRSVTPALLTVRETC